MDQDINDITCEFYVIFFISNFSVGIALFPFKLLGILLYDTLEGNMSQNLYLGLVLFLLCRNFGKTFLSQLFTFYIIKL